MDQAKKVEEISGEPGKHIFYCEGCKTHHFFQVAPAGPPTWTFNGNFVKPTVNPSIMVTWPAFRELKDDVGVPGTEYMHTCHSFIRDGQIQYLGDCTHEFANKTIELTEI